MESKNFKLASSACLIGIGGAVLLGTVVKKQFEERKRERIKAELRQFFNQLGEIAVLYVKEFESDKDTIRGGLVMNDETIYLFTYENGQISYEEDKRDCSKNV